LKEPFVVSPSIGPFALSSSPLDPARGDAEFAEKVEGTNGFSAAYEPRRSKTQGCVQDNPRISPIARIQQAFAQRGTSSRVTAPDLSFP
jgi:hypothetical protein